MFTHRTTMEHLHMCVLNCSHKKRLEHPKQLENLDMYILECVLQNVHKGIIKCAIIMDVCQKLYVHMCAAQQRREQPAGVLEAKICKTT